MKKELKIVVTGGPGGGKTTALDLFQREFQSKVKIIPEAATMLFQSGIRRETSSEKIKFIQKTIYDLQISLESISTFLDGHQILVCDRGTLDGLAYWPDEEENYFKTIKSTFAQELNRYDGIIFFETAASNGNDILGNNPYRTEDAKRAIELDKRLQRIWSQHPKYQFIASTHSFMSKINAGIKAIEKLIQ
ncbi:MAG: AAA family ATPase [Bacteriovoracaceae bacterium]|nr:AAA family ATPase [Bacteriovoracaceae bacterium]